MSDNEKDQKKIEHGINASHVSAGRDINIAGRDIHVSNDSSGNEALKTVFAEVWKLVDALPERERRSVESIVKDIEDTANEVQQGVDDEKTVNFLEQRLHNLYNMRSDIAEVLITTLAAPPVGIALVLKKIGSKVKENYNL